MPSANWSMYDQCSSSSARSSSTLAALGEARLSKEVDGAEGRSPGWRRLRA
jgi:hypothetical protein